MGNKKNEKGKPSGGIPKANNDQLGENASAMNSDKYSNKGPKATEKCR